MPLLSALSLGTSMGRLQIERPTFGFTYDDGTGQTLTWDLDAAGEIEIAANATMSASMTLTATASFTAGVLVVGARGGNANKYVGNVTYDNGGLGGITYAEVTFEEGKTYTLFAGSPGSCDPAANYGGGGGAASGLLDYKTLPVVIAGGGGGGAYTLQPADISGQGGTGGTSDAGDIRANDLTGTIPFTEGGGTDLYAGYGYGGGSPGSLTKGGKALSGRPTSPGGVGVLSKYSGALGGKTGGGGGAGGYFGGGGGGDILALGAAYSGGGGSGYVSPTASSGQMLAHNAPIRTSFRTTRVLDTEEPGKAFIFLKSRSNRGIQATGGDIISNDASLSGIIYQEHRFNSSGVFEITNCQPGAIIEVLTLGGGGSGGCGDMVRPYWDYDGRFYKGGQGGALNYAVYRINQTSATFTVTVGAGGAPRVLNPWPGRGPGKSGTGSEFVWTAGDIDKLGIDTANGGSAGDYWFTDWDVTYNTYYEGTPSSSPAAGEKLSTYGIFKSESFDAGADGGATPVYNVTRYRSLGTSGNGNAGTGVSVDRNGLYGYPVYDSRLNISYRDAKPNSGCGGGAVMVRTDTGTQNYLPAGFATGSGASGFVLVRYAFTTSGDLEPPEYLS